jgi:hypothetical protein
MRAVTVPALVHEATRKSGVVWVAAPGGAPRAVWHVWHDGADYVLHGGGEQELPDLTGSAEVTVRSKHLGGTVVRWLADAAQVDPAGEEWAAVEPLLRKARLHAEADPTGRWRTTATLTRLTPTGQIG